MKEKLINFYAKCLKTLELTKKIIYDCINIKITFRKNIKLNKKGGLGLSTGKSWTVSLPPKMIKEAEKVAKEGNVSKSDLVKEALGQFLETHQWKKLQQEAVQKAKEFSFVSEEEVERNVHESRK